VRQFSLLENACLQPLVDQAEQHAITHPLPKQLSQVGSIQSVQRLSNRMPYSRTRLMWFPTRSK